MVSDELTGALPDHATSPTSTPRRSRTGPEALCLESKSLKIYLSRFRDQGVFCEALAVQIRDEVAAALELDRDGVHVTLRAEGARRDHDHRLGVGKHRPRGPLSVDRPSDR